MKKNKLTIAYSSCPNDTFMFDALVNQKLDTGKLEFEPHIADIEELNRLVQEGYPDVSKISFAVFPEISDRYSLLTSGSAVGYRNGPLVVSKYKIYPDELSNVKMAIPGKNTTANFLLTILFPQVKDKKEYLFSDIEEAVLSNETDAGLLIHETRFTYEKKGLKKVTDLGELWEKEFESPVPLGGIVIKRSLDPETKRNVQNLVKKSVKFAFDRPGESRSYIKSYARELSDNVIYQHIDLYVNDFSVDLGEKGKKAIELLFEKGEERGLFKLKNDSIFSDKDNRR
ncbi:MAG: 1,4-dihydroxy-6-naphthoate synthase [Bacteroidales bacterium]